MKALFIIALLVAGCQVTDYQIDALEGCEDRALECLDLVDGGGEDMQYLRGEFCGCLGQGCIMVIRDARGTGNVDTEVEQLMDAARCLRHRK
jgi:hypothetical protein